MADCLSKYVYIYLCNREQSRLFLIWSNIHEFFLKLNSIREKVENKTPESGGSCQFFGAESRKIVSLIISQILQLRTAFVLHVIFVNDLKGVSRQILIGLRVE